MFAVFGIGGAYLSLSSLDHPAALTDYAQASAIVVLGLIGCKWWLLFGKKVGSWVSWSNRHGGTYRQPNGVYLSKYGNVTDILKGTDPTTGAAFTLYRALYTPLSGRYQQGQHMCNVLLSLGDAADEPSSFAVVKHYYVKVPTVEDMLAAV
jgi:hypothetical protein